MTSRGRGRRLFGLLGLGARRPRERPADPRPAGRAAYVVGGTWRHGGTRVARRIGELLCERFGFEMRLVQGRQEAAPGLVTVDDVRRHATPDDVVVCNPSFSDHQLGLSCRARVIMYVQSVNAYRAIDGFCDRYVVTSSFVRDHLALHYGLSPSVIPAFVDLAELPEVVPFLERPAGAAVVYAKLYGDVLVDALAERLRRRGVALELLRPAWLAHPEFLRALARHRYAVCLAPLEGFGLVPLEALALGTVPVGFHGNGARDYLRDGVGAGLTQYPDLDGVVDRVEALTSDVAAAEAVSRAGPRVAAAYGRAAFDQRWTAELADLLGEPPR